MITFLNSFILPAIIAITIPLIIHFFNKQRKKRIEFSSIRFLQILEKQRLKKIKVYQYILIIVRTLLILFLVLAFARPTLVGNSLIKASTASTTAVIILDDGLHMRSYDEKGNRFLRAKDELYSLQYAFDPEDEVYIISSHNADKQYNNSFLITEWKCSYMNSDWRSVLSAAKKIFKNNPNYNRELYIISDFHDQGSYMMQILNEFKDIQIYLLKIGSTSINNISIDSLYLENKIVEVNKLLKLNVQLTNRSSQPQENIGIHLFLDNQRLSHGRISLSPDETRIASLSLKPKRYGFLNGYIELDDDDLLPDNRYYFSVHIPSRINLLFVDDRPSPFIRAGIESIQTNTNIKITTENYSAWARQNINLYDIIFLSNIQSLDLAMIERLKKFLEQRKTLIILPGIKSTPISLNKIFDQLNINVNIREIVTSSAPNTYFLLHSSSFKSPFFEGLFRDNISEFNQPRFYRYFKLLAGTDVNKILNFNNGDPFLLSTQGDIVFVFTSALSQSWTDLQYRGIFLPMLFRILRLSSVNASTKESSLRFGESLVFSVNGLIGINDFYFLGPENERIRIMPVINKDNINIEFNQYELPGNYKILAGTEEIATISINIRTPIASPIEAEMKEIIDRSEEIKVIGEGERDLDQIEQARFGQEFWRWSFILVLILLLIEFYFIKKVEGKESG